MDGVRYGRKGAGVACLASKDGIKKEAIFRGLGGNGKCVTV